MKQFIISFGIVLTVTSATFVVLPFYGWAGNTPQTEIKVTLFGQPCLLKGPFDEAALKAIHSVGPDQIPNLAIHESRSSREEAKKAIEKIRNNNHLPSLFDRYREKLKKRLEAQLAFLEALDSAKKNHESDTLIKVARKYWKDPDFQSFEILIKKIKTPAKTSSPQQGIFEQIFDAYNDGIDPDPESEFHRAIKSLNIQYICSFEESSQ